MKKFNKFAAAAASGLLAVSTLGMNVFADVEEPATTAPVAPLTVSYDVGGIHEKAVEPNLNGYVNYSVSAGTVGDLGTGYYQGTPDSQLRLSQPTRNGEYTYQGTIDVKPNGFVHDGIYVYTLSEAVKTNDFAGLANSKQESTNIYLRVSTTISGEKNYVWFVGDTSDAKKNAPEFDAEYNTFSVKVNKTVSGTMADHTLPFDFQTTITKDSINGVESFNVEGAKSNTVELGIPVNASIAASGSYTVYGVPAGYSYKTAETNSKGYTSTVTAGVESGTVDGNTEVTYNNKLDEITPMGIVKTSTPFALMLAAAGAFAAMFFRRKTEE